MGAVLEDQITKTHVLSLCFILWLGTREDSVISAFRILGTGWIQSFQPSGAFVTSEESVVSTPRTLWTGETQVIFIPHIHRTPETSILQNDWYPACAILCYETAGT